MKIVDILKQSAELLALTKEVALLSTATIDNQQELLKNEEINSLFNLVKYSIQELCTNYIPLINTMQFQTLNNKYALSNFQNYIRVRNIYKNGVQVTFKIVNRCLVMEEDGCYVLEYETYPEIVSLFDELDFLTNFSPDVIVLGLTSYYSLSRGLFEEFNTMHEQYVEKAESLRELKIFNTPQRRWE